MIHALVMKSILKFVLMNFVMLSWQGCGVFQTVTDKDPNQATMAMIALFPPYAITGVPKHCPPGNVPRPIQHGGQNLKSDKSTVLVPVETP